jgi:hypothetical protein
MKTIIDSTIKTAALTGMMAVAALLGFASCDNETTTSDPICNCPNKIHGTAPCDCGGVDCACEQKEWTLNYGIKLNNQTQSSIKNKIPLINEILDDLDTSASYFTTVKSRTNVTLTIVSGNGYNVINANTIEIGVNELDEAEAVIFGFLYTAFYDMAQISVMNDRFNSKIRLANGENMNIDRLIAFSRQFDTTKQTVREAFRAQGTEG